MICYVTMIVVSCTDSNKEITYIRSAKEMALTTLVGDSEIEVVADVSSLTLADALHEKKALQTSPSFDKATDETPLTPVAQRFFYSFAASC